MYVDNKEILTFDKLIKLARVEGDLYENVANPSSSNIEIERRKIKSRHLYIHVSTSGK